MNQNLAVRRRAFPTRFLTVMVALTVLAVIWLAWSVFDSYRHTSRLQQRTLQIEQLLGKIVHLDEVLTMSARMAAATGESHWETRYLSFEPQLDKAIRDAGELAESLGTATLTGTTQLANEKLVALEKQAFQMVRQGRLAEAQALLRSEEYESQKLRYSQGVQEFSDALQGAMEGATRRQQRSTMLRLGLVSMVLGVLLASWGGVLRALRRSQEALLDSHDRLAQATTVSEGINRIFEETLTCQTEAAVARTCLSVALELTQSPVGFIGEGTPDGPLRILASSDPRLDSLRPEASTLGEADSWSTRLWRDVSRHDGVVREAFSPVPAPGADPATTTESRPFLGVPLRVADQTVGLIGLTGAPQGYTSAHEEELTALSVAFVEALRSKRNEEEIARHREHLEERVRERTQRLETAIAELHRQMAGKRQAEEKLVQERNLLRTVIDNLPLFIFVKDRASRFLINSRAHLRVLRAQTQEEVLGKTDFDVFPRELAEGYFADEQEVIRSGVPVHNREESTLDPDNHLRWLLTDKVPLRDAGGRIIGIVGMSHDITERKLAEDRLKRITEELEIAKTEAEAANHAKSRFLANMSHEIRTPMSAVIGMSDLLLDTVLTEEQRDYAETIHLSAETLLSLLNDILDLSKIEAGKLALESIPFNLHTCIETAANTFAAKAADKHLELAVFLDPDLPERVIGDPGRLRQVLLNLVSNAIKFTDQGEVTLRAQRDPDPAPNGRLRLRFELQDTGIGIPESERQRMFESFVQADSSTNREYGGSGLGLAICQRLANLMDGDLRIASGPNGGTTVTFRALFAPTEPGPSGAAAQPIDLAGLPVLVVDDHKTNRQILRAYLTQWGCTVTEAADADEALAAWSLAAESPTPFRLALVDYEMPRMNGEELARAVKRKPALATTRLILLTSVTHRGSSRELLAAGFDGYLVKPVKHSALLDCITTILDREAHLATTRPAFLVTEATCKQREHPPLRLLVVEDSVPNQKLLRRLLEKGGYACDAVSNGEEALRALDRARYDLILMDCQMPVLNGYQATREIRRRESNGHHTVIVALTASALKGDRERCLAAGMDDYLTKPVNRDSLYAVIARWTSSDRPRSTSPSSDAETRSSPAPEAPVPSIDWTALRRLVGDDSETLRDLSRSFVEEAQARLRQLRLALDAETPPQVAALAHGLKSTALNFQMPALAERAAELEALANNGDLASAHRLLDQLLDDFEQVRRALEQHLQGS